MSFIGLLRLLRRANPAQASSAGDLRIEALRRLNYIPFTYSLLGPPLRELISGVDRRCGRAVKTNPSERRTTTNLTRLNASRTGGLAPIKQHWMFLGICIQ